MQFRRCALAFVISALLLPLLSSSLLRTPLGVSITLAQEVTDGDLKLEADRFYQEGDRLLNEGQYQAALEPFQQALEIYREVGDRQGEGNTLNRSPIS
jgi:tetratricopeptide (TPR) repeat protein